MADAERRYEEAREVGEAEERRARDKERKRKRADARIGAFRLIDGIRTAQYRMLIPE